MPDPEIPPQEVAPEEQKGPLELPSKKFTPPTELEKDEAFRSLRFLLKRSLRNTDSEIVLGVAARLLCNWTAVAIRKWMEDKGVKPISAATLVHVRATVHELAHSEQVRIVELVNNRALGISDKIDMGAKLAAIAKAQKETHVDVESPYVKTLKAIVESTMRRIEELEKEAKTGNFSEKRENQLMGYYDRLKEMRKELETERLQSEVVQSWKRATVEIGKLALSYMPDEFKKRDFIARVREIEKRDW